MFITHLIKVDLLRKVVTKGTTIYARERYSSGEDRRWDRDRGSGEGRIAKLALEVLISARRCRRAARLKKRRDDGVYVPLEKLSYGST